MPDDIYYDEPTAEEAYAIDNNLAPVQEEVDAPKVDAATSFERRLIAVQRRLKAPKSAFNSFGGYYYRSCEDILEALKPLLEEYDLLLTITDDIHYVEGRFYVKATATVADVETGLSKKATAFAREPENRKGSDQSQVTGSCSSYARKFALNALFLIDDTKDADVPLKQEPKQPPASGPFVARCKSCGTQYQFQNADQYNQFIAHPNCCPNPQWQVV